MPCRVVKWGASRKTAGAILPDWRLVSALVLIAGVTTLAPCARAQSFIEYGVAGNPCGIVAGSDGRLWFTEGDKIGALTLAGQLTEFPMPPNSGSSCPITVGPDGNIWFVENAGKIATVTPTGTFTEYPVPNNLVPAFIASGSDGNLWFTTGRANGELSEIQGHIFMMTPTGIFTDKVPTSMRVEGIAAGPDGNLWVTAPDASTIFKVNPSGGFVEYNMNSGDPRIITSGPDGNVWFTELLGNAVGRITTGGNVTIFAIPTADSRPYGITSRPDGNLWFIEFAANNIGVVTSTGAMTEYQVPTAGSGLQFIASGADDNLWFTESIGNIGKLVPGAASPTGTPTPTGTATSTVPTASPTPLCASAPQAGCRKPTVPLKSSVVLKDRLPDTHDVVGWTWKKGEATLKTEFGDPLGTTNYALCLYDDAAGTPSLKLSADIPAGGTCNNKPCWKETAHGFKYADRDGILDGVTLLVLKEGLEGLAAIQMKGQGVNLQMPVLPLTQDPAVIVQLVNAHGLCWAATYSAPAQTNEQVQFRDKSD